MGFGGLVSVAQLLEDMLHYDKYLILLHGRTQPIQSLREKFTAIQSFLEDFPWKVTMKFEGRVRAAAYEAEDIIEKFILAETSLVHSGACGFQNFNQLCDDLQKVIGKIDCIIEETKWIKLESNIKDSQAKVGESSYVLGSSSLGKLHLDQDVIVGLDDEVMESIKDRVCGQSLKREIIPIVGMGGIGKTTLAKHLYNDQLIVEYFDILAWAAISQEYSVREILLKLLRIQVPIEDSIEPLIECLYKRLKGKRYLIVLDDMWDGEAWDGVRRAFPDDNNGSRIILTTRVSDVATYVDSLAPLHEMCLLNNDQSWDLLHKKLFANNSCPPELETVGRMISTKCKGLPLAIDTIVGLLSIEISSNHWNNIAENVISAVTHNADELSELLSLSYNHLPHYLKSCFLFMGGFPEDYEVHVSKLNRLWKAEGFLQPSGSKLPEEIAEEYLENLVQRNLILVISRRSNGKIKYCGIHDILRELCIETAKKEGFFKHVMMSSCDNIKGVVKNSRSQVSIHSDKVPGSSINPNTKQELTNTLDGSQISTGLIVHGSDGLQSYLKTFRLLRVLELAMLVLNKFPEEIFELFFLRYLDLFCKFTSYRKLPSSISKLWNLETLIFNLWGGGIIDLPSDIWRMPRLRHIVFSVVCFPPLLETPSFPLHNLHTLSRVIGFECSNEILEMLPNVKKLGIYYRLDSSEAEQSRSQFNNLPYFHLLEKLSFRVVSTVVSSGVAITVDTQSASRNRSYLSKNLAFPKTLRKLTLEGPLGFPWEKMTIVDSLPHLEVLKLKGEVFSGEVWETREGEYFCQLRVLIMWGLDLHRWVISESSHLPRLERLGIYNCRQLGEIPESIGEIQTLQLIEVEDCSESLMASVRQVQEEQEGYGNYSLQVRIKS